MSDLGGGSFETDELDHDEVSDEPLSAAEIIDELIALIEKAKSMPLSSSVIVSREDVMALLLSAREALPDELLTARRLLKDHEELRLSVEREAAELLDEARARAAFLVQRAEVVRQARHQADRLIEEAESEARRVRHEADDYVDRKLAAFEIVLDRTIRTVQAGRERLNVVPVVDQLPESERAGQGSGDASDSEGDGLFDQDSS